MSVREATTLQLRGYTMNGFCDFDFHYIYVTSTRKKDLLLAGVKIEDIRAKVVYSDAVAGYGHSSRVVRRSRKHYEGSVYRAESGLSTREALEELALKMQAESPKADIIIRYHCAD